MPHLRCFVNLPDIIPSIVYEDSNSKASLFKSSQFDIPNVTGEKLYNVYEYNNRLHQNEYDMPILYSMAKKIMVAQKAALKENYSLKIYETYRPSETQKRVGTNLKTLIAENETVSNGIFGKGWSEDWFIAQGVSNHQKGFAMDVSLVKVTNTKAKKTGNYNYTEVTNYTELKMPTAMHELSDAAVTFKYAVSSNSETAWKSAPLASTMTDGAKRLQKYCTGAGLTPLASEWWHFNDLATRKAVGSTYSLGGYYLSKNCSVEPD